VFVYGAAVHPDKPLVTGFTGPLIRISNVTGKGWTAPATPYQLH
jgi:hypothetical protein